MWFGVILYRQHFCGLEFCVQFDKKRNDWELPKGGAKILSPRKSTECMDSSPFATARGELFEECGVWISWRKNDAFEWMNTQGVVLHDGPRMNAFLCTMLQPDDEVDRQSQWMTLSEFISKSRRHDHIYLMRRCVERTCHRKF